MIPYARQAISEKDIVAVEKILRSDWLTQGPAIEQFEKSVADYCNAQYAVAICNASSALHLACLALEVGPGDRVWTAANTFSASANCALHCGATVDFVDIDSRTYNMCPEALEKKLVSAKKQGTLPKVVIPVHFSGQPCDMQAIHQLAQDYSFSIIEDASHAIGAHYQETKIGDCRYSDITVFSFHPVKLITTGEGGMLLTQHAELSKKLHLLRSHGITRNNQQMHNTSAGPWYYEQVALGYNYRMTDIQAALGISQLGQLDQFIEKRREVVAKYHAALNSLPLVLPWQDPKGQSAWHLYVVQIEEPHQRATIFQQLRAADIHVNVHYIPVYRHPFYQKLGFQSGYCPVAENYYERAISLPLYYHLRHEEQAFVIATLQQLLK